MSKKRVGTARAADLIARAAYHKLGERGLGEWGLGEWCWVRGAGRALAGVLGRVACVSTS